MITRTTLRESLFPDRKLGEHTLPIITQKNFGPGQLDGWRVVQGEENCFIHASIKKTANARPKIIFSDASLNDQALTNTNIVLISTLVDNDDYDVYFWPGPAVKFNEFDCAITNSSDFWKKRNHIVFASAEEIKHSLALQATTTDYIIIDKDAKEKLEFSCALKLIELRQSKSAIDEMQKMDYLYLRDFNQLKLLTPEQIESIEALEISNAVSIVQMDLKQFNFTRLKQIHIASAFVKEIIFPFSHTVEYIYLKNFTEKIDCDFSCFPNLKFCHIDGKLKNINLSLNTKLVRVDIECGSLVNNVLLPIEAPMLEHLHVKGPSSLSSEFFLETKKFNKLKFLHIHQFHSVTIDLSDANDLQSFIACHMKNLTVHLGSLKNLKTWSMQPEVVIFKNVAHFPELKEFSLDTSDAFMEQPFVFPYSQLNLCDGQRIMGRRKYLTS